MTKTGIQDVIFGEALPLVQMDTSLAAGAAFAEAVGYAGSGRFEDHAKARAEGLPGAVLPGIMAMGYFSRMLGEWAPTSRILHLDAVFRAPVLADQPHSMTGVVTDLDEEAARVTLDLTIVNAGQETRVFGTATLLLP